METPKTVLDLIERFNDHCERYRSTEYNEAQVRREFIDPLFEALGWDVQNKKGYAEPYKEVVHEDSIKVGGVTKAPDYSFRIGGRRLFFLEAKKPAINLKEDASSAYQLRRYAWTAKLPVSILTDFEEFIVYDTRVKPEQNDKASTARVLYISYMEYADRWGEIAALFSPQAIQKGALDKYVESKSRKRGTAEVDDAFLAEIEEWRDLLARNIALRNPGLKQRELNFAVQLIIDRIIFLRICEDRGIENFAQLQALLNGTDIYARLRYHFERADERYNSGLFHFHKERDRAGTPDTLTPKLNIDDKVLKAIIRRLYYPDSPYEFSVFPAEILGHVYERFLGSVICLSPGGRATVEQKPEVRKAGGVYYTPTYIVEYIVKHTVGTLLEGKTPQEVAGCTETWRPAKGAHALTILDPACGSGSFLLGAYQYLLDWHLQYYSQDASKWSKGKEPRIFQYHRGGWRLTTMERKRILLANIYGVDIDTQAVEVTKLSLLLKVLEGENSDSLQQQLSLLHQRALPDLANNIKCGNSLIGPDFYQGQQLDAFDEEEQYRINAFDWNTEFAAIMKSGGFDAVIGNPPYLFITEVPDEMREYYYQRFDTVRYRFDLYGAFIEQAHRRQLNVHGHFGFIIPHTLLSNDSFARLRSMLAVNTSLISVVDFGPGVFATAKNETMVLIFRNDLPSASSTVSVTCTSPKGFPVGHSFHATQSAWAKANGEAWLLHVSPQAQGALDRINRCKQRLSSYCTANQGLRTGDNEKYLSVKPRGKDWRPAVGGKHIARYAPLNPEIYVLYRPELLDAPRRKEIFDTPRKIVVQEIRNIKLPRRIVATLDEERVYCLQSTNVINCRVPCECELEYILGFLNSGAVNYYFRCNFPGNNHIPSNQLLRIPIPTPPSRRAHDRMASLVRRMLDLNKRLPDTRTDHARTVLERQIAATDNEIDRLVYELYGLTDDEIAIVEQSSG